MATANRACTAPTRVRNPRRPTRPHTISARGLVAVEDDDAVMLTPPQTSAAEVAQSR